VKWIEPVIADELWSTLLRFHREIALPDVDRIVGARIEPLRDDLASFKRETHANFDAVWNNLGRLQSEYHSLTAAMKRVEQRLARVEEKIGLDVQN
jgi:DnaJ-domain-containing protein 1